MLTSGVREGTSPDDLSPRGPKKLQVQTSPPFKIQGTGQREAHPWREATFPRPGLATHSIYHTNWCKGGGMTQTRPMRLSLWNYQDKLPFCWGRRAGRMEPGAA